MTFQALWMLSALGTAVLATVVRTRPGAAALAIGFVATAAWTVQSGLPVDASWIGCLVALAAAGQLASPDAGAAAIVGAAGAGVVAAAWGAVLQAEGIPLALALGITGVTMISSVWLTNQRPVFAPTVLREEALLILLAAGVLVGMTPTVVQGWQSAVALNMAATPGASAQLVPVWTLSFVGAAVALGALRSAWRRG
ncbi:MAG: hypothetical protein ABI868_03010 [Acidobacteriota bacterium]